MFKIGDVHKGRRTAVCKEILDDLPEWFGIPDAKARYIAGSAGLPMIAASIGVDPVGFVSLKSHTKFSAELYVLAVKRRFHRQGIGRGLVSAATKFAISSGFSFLTVKTLAPSNPDPAYASTRKFYEAVGFLPIEVFPTLWDAKNPCLLMIKPLR